LTIGIKYAILVLALNLKGVSMENNACVKYGQSTYEIRAVRTKNGFVFRVFYLYTEKEHEKSLKDGFYETLNMSEPELRKWLKNREIENPDQAIDCAKQKNHPELEVELLEDSFIEYTCRVNS
jgi:hypothetical protein